jgi:predicted Zn-dependent peptidase
MTSTFHSHTLSNGLRIVVECMPGVQTAAAGFLVRAGARDETPDVAGVSHFLEHMCFKGTPNRDARQINLDFDNLGGRPNAFTSQDRTFYHAVTRASDVARQIEILADLMRSILPPDEFDLEKQTVLNEIAMSQDHLESVAFDLLLDTVFAGHSLHWPVLGYESTIGPLARDRMHAYFQEHYAPDNMILLCAGNVEPQMIFDEAQRWCGDWKPSGYRRTRVPPAVHTGTAVRQVTRFNQQVIALCHAAPPAVDPLNDTADAAAVILGGENSRIFWNIVQTGISSRAGSFRLDYEDCALMILYGVTEPDNAEQLTDALRAEAAAICRQPVADHEIQRVRNKQQTLLAVEGESPYHRLTQVMDDVDYRGRPRTVEERLASVAAIGADSILECFRRYPLDGDGCLISVGPRNWPASD